MAKPSRKQRQGEVYSVVFGLIVLIGLSAMFSLHMTNFYFIIGLLLFAAVVSSIASSFVPDMRKKENKNKNMYTGLPKKPNTRSTAKKTTSGDKPSLRNSTILRSENEIMTLPLEDISWREFEELCYLYYKSKGYRPQKTSEGADGGVDLVVFNRHHNTKVAIQIKHFKKGQQVDVKVIRELDSAKKNHGCLLAEIITSSRFTRDALREADRRHVVCRGEEWIHSKLLPWREQETKKKGLA